MKPDEPGDPTSQATSEAAAEDAVPAKTPASPPEPNQLSEQDLEAVSGGTVEKTTEGVKKTMQTQ